MTINRIKLKNMIFYIYTFILSSGILIENRASDKEYVLTFIFMALGLVFFFDHGKMRVSFGIESQICFLMIAMWFYGCIIGIINDNSISYIFRNFVGMLLYVLYFFLENNGLNYKKVCTYFLILSILHLTITIVSYIILLMKPTLIPDIPYVRLARIHYADVYGINQLFLNGKEMIHIVTGYSLYKILYSKRIKVRYVLLYAMSAFADFVIIWTDSMKFGFLIISASIFVIFLIQKRNMKMMILSLFMILGVIWINKQYGSIVARIFDKNDFGNSVRYQEISYVLSHVTMFGKGLGSDYSAIGKGYNIEVSFLDLIYKYGIWSILIFAVYAYTIYFALYILAISIKKKKNDWIYVMPLVLMGYLFSALSNPVLFSPLNVLLHIFCLLLISAVRRNGINFYNNIMVSDKSIP